MRICAITGAKTTRISKTCYSAKTNKVSRKINIQKNTYFISKMNKFINLKLSTRGIRTIKYFGGLENWLLNKRKRKCWSIELVRLQRKLKLISTKQALA